MKVIDLSVPVRPGMVVWPGEAQMEARPVVSMAAGAGCNVSLLTIGSHCGTHVDAPRHFIADGATLDQVSLQKLTGRCVVVEITEEGDITAPILDRLVSEGGLPDNTERVIFKTSNTRRRLLQEPAFCKDYAAVAPDAAAWLVDHGILTVGVDYYSVETFHPQAPLTHRLLLGAGVFVMEGLNLTETPPGEYTLVCAPLNWFGGDGAPARVLLLPPVSD